MLPAAALAADRPSENKPKEEQHEPFRIGAIGGVGFPHPFAIEAMAKLHDVVAFGVEYGFMPKTTIGAVEASLSSFAGDFRLFPFRGAFFVGIRSGRQKIGASGTVTYAEHTAKETAAAQAWFVNPRVGFLWTWSSGLSLGLDAGAQVPIHASLETKTPAGAPAGIDASIARATKVFGNGVAPTIDLLRAGFLF